MVLIVRMVISVIVKTVNVPQALTTCSIAPTIQMQNFAYAIKQVCYTQYQALIPLLP